MFCLFVRKYKISRVKTVSAIVAALLSLIALPTARAAMEPPLPTGGTALMLSPVPEYPPRRASRRRLPEQYLRPNQLPAILDTKWSGFR